MPRPGTSTWRRLTLRVGVLVATLAVLATPLVTAPASATSDPTVTVQPSTGITDGQALKITVKGTSDVPVATAVARLCRDGVTYAPGPVTGNSPGMEDFGLNGPNCPLAPISSSADNNVNDNRGASFADPAGDTFLFRAGAGVVNWKDGTTDRTLTCDADHPCALVVELLVGTGSGQHWQPYPITLTYAKDDPFAGCGGPATGVVESGGSDRMVDAWVQWTRQECGRSGRSGAATRASFVGEGDAVDSFRAGSIDLAYSSGGFDTAMGLASPPDPSQPTADRASVAVPLAVNAAVIGVAGGQRVSNHDVPFRDIKLTTAESAGLLSGGLLGIGPYEDAIKARNPELSGGVIDTHAPSYSVAAYAGAEATTWYTTRWLKTLAADAWKVPDNSTYFGTNVGKPRGISTSLAIADPSFANALDLVTGRPQLRKGLIGVPIESSGVWALTDLASAQALSMTPVQVQNANGDFVAPTPESLTAAVSTMKLDDKGVLIADPSATAASGATQPYPLTMVEYAIVPAEPLVDQTSCTARTGSQALLKGWLDYLVGDGQTVLPAGFVALPADLHTSALAAIDKVGAAPVTGSCAGKVTDPAPGSPLAPAAAAPAAGASPAATGTPNGDLSDGTVIGSGGSGFSGGSVSGANSSASGAPATAVVAAAASVSKPANNIGIPGFGGSGLASWVVTVVALLGIAVVTSFGSLASSGRLAGIRQRLKLKR